MPCHTLKDLLKSNELCDILDNEQYDRLLKYIDDNCFSELYLALSDEGVDLMKSCRVARRIMFDIDEINIIVPENMEELEPCCFENFYNLRNVKLPNKLLNIATSAFADCTVLDTVHIPDTVISVGEYAFQYCKCIDKLHFPTYLKLIPRGCCSNCHLLSDVRLDRFIERIEAFSFYNCYCLEEIDLPYNVDYIGPHAFRGSGLSKVEMHPGVKYIGSSAFDTTSEELQIRFYGTTQQWNSIKLGGPISKKSITVLCDDAPITV